MPRRPDPLASLRSLRTSSIDIDAMQRRFDLPIEDQFATRRHMTQGLADTKRQMLAKLAGKETMTIVRVMNGLPAGWVDGLDEDSEVGDSWSMSIDGALLATTLDHGREGIVIRARISPADVDWSTTVAMLTFREGEMEIVPAHHARVTLSKVLDLADGKVLREFPDGLEVGTGDAPEPDETTPSVSPNGP